MPKAACGQALGAILLTEAMCLAAPAVPTLPSSPRAAAACHGLRGRRSWPQPLPQGGKARSCRRGRPPATYAAVLRAVGVRV